MTRRYRLAVADSAAARKALSKVLANTGHIITVQAASVEQLVEEYSAANPPPDLVLADVSLLADCTPQAAAVLQAYETPIVVMSAANSSQEKLHQAHAFRPFGFVVKPARKIDLCEAIDIAIERFIEYRLAKVQADQLKADLEDRKVVERAKGFIMKRQGVDETHAYNCLQKFARDRGQRMVDVAKSIVLVEADLLCAGRT